MKEFIPKFEEEPFVLDELIDEAIAKNPKALLDYRAGIDSALDDLVNEVVHRTGGKVEARNVRHMILKKL